MRTVADTNIVVSGILWNGAPRDILNLARRNAITLFTTPDLLLELEDVLQRDKFAHRLSLAGARSHDLVMGYAALATVISPVDIPPTILEDPDDDAVIACAVAARAAIIVSDDRHLITLGEYQGIVIVNAAEMLKRIA